MIAIILQARLGSTRLPNKVLLELPKGSGVTVLERCIAQCLKCDIPDEAILTTPDRELAGTASKMHIPFHVYHGERDVLKEYYQAAKFYNVDIIARVTADCPLIDPEIIDNCIDLFLDSDVDLVYNTDESTGQLDGEGSDVEVFSYETLEKACLEAKTPADREHVTTYMRRTMTTEFVPMKKLGIKSLNTLQDYEDICRMYQEKRFSKNC